MIGTAFLYGLFVILKVVAEPITWLSDASLPADISASITTASSYIAVFANILPVTTLVLILVAMLSVEGAIWLLKIFNFTIRKIPGLK